MNKDGLLKALITVLLTLFSEENMKQFADAILDFVENKVKGSASQIDDALVLPLCAKVRDAFGIPDNDEPPAEEPAATE